MTNDPVRPLENFQFQTIGQKPSLLGRLDNDSDERRQINTPTPSPEPVEDHLPLTEAPLRRPRLLEALSHSDPENMAQQPPINGTQPSGTVSIFDPLWTRILQPNVSGQTANGTTLRETTIPPPSLDFEAILSLYSRLEALRNSAEEKSRPFVDEDVTAAVQAAKSEAARIKGLAGNAHTAAKKAVHAAQESLRLSKECLHSADVLSERVDQSLTAVTHNAEAGKSWNEQLKTLNDEMLSLRTWIENQHRIDQDRSKLVDALRRAVEERDQRLAQVSPPPPVASSSSSRRPADAMVVDSRNSPSTPTASDNEATAEIEALLKEQAIRKKRSEEEARRRQQEERLLQEKSDRLTAELAELERARQEKLRVQEEETKRLEEEERELEKKKAAILENARLKAQLRMSKDRQCSQSATLPKDPPPKPVGVAPNPPLRLQPVTFAQTAIPTPLDSASDRRPPAPSFPVPVHNPLPTTPPNSAVAGTASMLPSPPVPSPKASLTTAPPIQRVGTLQTNQPASSTTTVSQQDTAVADQPIKAEPKEVVIPAKRPAVKVKQEEDVPMGEMKSPAPQAEPRRQEPPAQPSPPIEQPVPSLNPHDAPAPQAPVPNSSSTIPTGPMALRPHLNLPRKPSLPARSYPRSDHPSGPPDLPSNSLRAPDDRGERGYPPRRYNPRLPSPNSRHYSPPRPRSPPPRNQYSHNRRRSDYYTSAYNERSRDTSNSNSASGDDERSPAPGDHASAGRKRRREDDDPPGGPLNRRGRCDLPGPQRSYPQATWPEQPLPSGSASRRSPSPVHRDIPRQRQLEEPHPPYPPPDLPPRPKTPTGSLVGRIGDRQLVASPIAQQPQHSKAPPSLPRPPPPRSPSPVRRSPTEYSHGQSGGTPTRPLLDRFSDSAPKGYSLPGRNSTRGGRGRGSTRGRHSTSHQTNQHIPTLMDRIS